MSGRARFQDTPLLNVGLRSAFAGELERGRMATVRLQIQAVRKAWVTNETYQGLMATVKDRCLRETLPDPVRDSLETILDAFHDYADVDLARPSKQRSEQYDALELYCSDDGYNYLYKLMYKALRSEDADDELLLAATTLVELLTIDLYNLRMSQIGDPRYANFEGITHRGMIVPRSIIGQYEAILECPDLAQRNFGIPLGLMSSTTDKGITDTFSETFNNPDLVRMYWTIHVHGIDEALLQEYHALYPESVVTSICAMPVARVSPFSEKEILLRGAFFHLIAINKSCMKGEDVINLVVVMMNANRDHTTETSLDLAEKKTQRDMFSRIVSASKFQACSWISAAYNQHDSRAYQSLATQKLGELKEVLDRANLAFGQSRSRDYPSVWLGGTSTADFPRAYGKARLAFQDAVARGRWTQVEELMNLDYDWDKGRWFNMGWLSGSREEEDSVANSGVPDNDKSLTLLHRLVLGKPEDFGGQAVELEAWGRLLVEAQEPTAWSKLGRPKTTRDRDAVD